ncbi:MAG: LysM peptidoglycan-binding domain-containing protein [Bdellovibrionales bacterium]|nr:LysM peptidoglycan-binding domain-containing protein [Bdellovibrionales bacterium]
MKRKISNGFGTSVLILALMILSACTSSMELEDGDYSGDETVATTEGEEAAPADAVPGEELAAGDAKSSEPLSPDSNIGSDGNPELELAAGAAAKNDAKSDAVASTDSPIGASEETAVKDAAPVEELPPLDLATDSALPPPSDVDVTPKVVTPGTKTEVASASPEVPVETPLAQTPDSSSTAPKQTVASTDTPGGDGVSYTVQKGDTLMKISWEQYGDLFRWREIYALNKSKIADPNNVPPGTVIQIAGQGRSPASAMERNGEQYLIVFGDTLGKISGKVYGSMGKWKKIWENNKRLIRDPNKIYAGFYLYYVPEAKMTSREEDADSSEPLDS